MSHNTSSPPGSESDQMKHRFSGGLNSDNEREGDLIAEKSDFFEKQIRTG